jgi:nucleoid-associated protein YgaU
VPDAPAAHRARASRARALRRSSRRRRRIAGLIRFTVFLLLIFVAVWAGVRVAHAGEDGALYSGNLYVVQEGDDLWSIAAARYGDSIDPRKAVYAIREANHLSESALQPGQGLQLPYLEP